MEGLSSSGNNLEGLPEYGGKVVESQPSSEVSGDLPPNSFSPESADALQRIASYDFLDLDQPGYDELGGYTQDEMDAIIAELDDIADPEPDYPQPTDEEVRAFMDGVSNSTGIDLNSPQPMTRQEIDALIDENQE